MDKVVLKAALRESFGKSANKHLRKEGQIPAVVYKGGDKGENIQVNGNELWHALHTDAGENVIITIDISDKSQKTVIVKEMQVDPINDKYLHLDFQEISLKEKLKVKIPVVIKGEAVGVTEEEGILTQVSWEVEVECLPTAIPEHIDVNVAELRINDAIHVKDIVPPPDVVMLDDPEQVVVSVSPPQAEEEVEEELPGEEGEEPELIKKGKKEEEGEGEGEQEGPAEEAPSDKGEEG